MVGTGQQFVELYRKIHALLSPKGIPINADIPLWLNDHPHLTYDGVNHSCTEWVMPYVDKMTIMAYRDWGVGDRNAATVPDMNGDPESIVNSCEFELQIAPLYNVKISAAVEVGCRVDPSWVSFCLDGSVYMEEQLNNAETFMRAHYTAFDSIVIHYRDSWQTLQPAYTLNGNLQSRETYEWEGAATVTDYARMNDLFDFCNTHAVKAVYLDLQVIITDLGTYMTGLLDFLEMADSNNIDVEFMLGNPHWTLAIHHDAALQMIGDTAQLIEDLRVRASKPVTVTQATVATSQATSEVFPLQSTSPNVPSQSTASQNTPSASSTLNVAPSKSGGAPSVDQQAKQTVPSGQSTQVDLSIPQVDHQMLMSSASPLTSVIAVTISLAMLFV
jgi:hypothetical protein